MNCYNQEVCYNLPATKTVFFPSIFQWQDFHADEAGKCCLIRNLDKRNEPRKFRKKFAFKFEHFVGRIRPGHLLFQSLPKKK